MQLKSINIEELRKLSGAARLQCIEEYRDEKENLILEYLRLQDILEEYNEKSNQVCCEIERINIILHEMGVE